MCNNCDLLQQATLRLSQDGSIKERLAEAYTSHLVALETDELPEQMRKEFGALCAAMHRESPLPRESAVRASVRKMSAHQASEYAALVVKLFAALARAEADCQPVAPRVARVSRAAVPMAQLLAAEA